MFNDRIEHLRQILQKNNVDSFLVSTTYNIFYFTGFSDYIADEREGFLFITKNDVYMLTSSLYADAVKRIAPHVTLLLTSPGAWYTELLTDICKKEQIKSIGFEDHDLRYVEYEEFYHVGELVPFSLRGFRSIKDKEEIASIEKACNSVDELFNFILTIIKEGMSEKEVALQMELFVREKQQHLAFPSIVAFGNHSAAIHHVPTDKKLEKGQFVLLDFGTKVNEYCSDMSRTLFCGTPTSNDVKMYNTVKDAQQKAIDFAMSSWGKEKVTTHSIDEAARNVVKENEFPTFPHALGHGIGLEVHEGPTLSRDAKDVLKVGMVYTIEPGVYFPEKSGVRIEDMFVMEVSGPRQLTHATKDLILM